MPIIDVKNLSFSYSEAKKALDDVSFSINEGDNVAIIGHNGSGKSTLAKLLIGLLHQSNGDIYVCDKKLEKNTVNDIRKNIALVFQNPDNQFIGQTVEDDIAFSLENRCVPQKEMPDLVKKYANIVGMENFLTKEPTSLSGGQKQRVAIASTLALEPKIVIFDESTSMLDPKGKKEILDVIVKLRKDDPKLTTIYITHDVEQTLMSDKIIVLNEGKLIASGKTKDLLKNKENLEEYGLAAPGFFELKDILEKNGINLEKCENYQQIVEILCQLK